MSISIYLDVIFCTLMSIVLTACLLIFKFIAYDPNKNSTVGDIFAAFDLFKDFILIFMLLSYIVK